jgi:hypothetical protein
MRRRGELDVGSWASARGNRGGFHPVETHCRLPVLACLPSPSWALAQFEDSGGEVVMGELNRGAFLKRAGLGTVAASLPGALGVEAAFAGSPNGHHVYVFVSFSQASTPAGGLTTPRIGMNGAGTFDPHARWVKGGGSYVLFDQAHANPKPLVAHGLWKAKHFVSYDTKGLGSYGEIQPAILELTVDLDGLGTGLAMTLVCNVGAVPLLTGEEEGWELEGTPFGDFHPLSPVVGITHLSVEGISLMRG